MDINIRGVKYQLKKLGLRKKEESSLEDIAMAIRIELETSGNCLGYRSLWHRLKLKHKLEVRRDTVMQLLRELDPEGVDCRKRKRMRRRKYKNPGPNFMWHVDGYDKLKPFGFCIHGAMDGFSRRIMWLQVSNTNNNPEIIAGYYLNCINLTKALPRVIRADLGTENVTMEIIHRYLRDGYDDSQSGENSFRYGKSTCNQRIEAWWSMFKRLGAGWWINFFKDLRDSGQFESGDNLHVECIRYVLYSSHNILIYVQAPNFILLK